MLQFIKYYGKYQSVRGSLGGVPQWGRVLLTVVAIPGLLLAMIGAMVLIAGIGLVILLTVPMYRLIAMLRPRPTRSPQRSEDFVVTDAQGTVINPQPRRQVEVKIVE